MKKIITLIAITAAVSLSLIAVSAQAEPLLSATGTEILVDLTDQMAGAANLGRTDPGQLVASIIKIALSFLGIIFLVLIIIAGFNWMTAGGNEEQIKSAQSRIKNAVIGLVIVLMAYAITYFIFKYLPISGGAGGFRADM